MELVMKNIFILKLLWLFLSFYTSYLSANPHPLVVEKTWLKNNLKTQEVIIIDVREPEDYLKSHIAGAINLPVTSTYDKKERRHLLAPLSVVNEQFNKAGIRHDAHLVLYDDGSFIHAARLFWVLEVFGHTKVSLLNNGLDEWQQAGYEVTNIPTKVQTSVFVPKINPDKLATTFSVQLVLHDPEHILIDVRSKEEYLGQQSKSEYFGHIPNAINIPATLNIDAKQKKIRPLAELAKIYKHLNINNPVTLYCNRGRKSAMTFFVLRRLGFKVNSYDGSWIEWSRYPKLPRENPSAIASDDKLVTK